MIKRESINESSPVAVGVRKRQKSSVASSLPNTTIVELVKNTGNIEEDNSKDFVMKNEPKPIFAEE